MSMMKLIERQYLVGDIWGGLASMLVALPASVAFGVTVYSTLGPSYASQGALWGIIGAILIGFLAPLLGGTSRLISAPCAPAAAVLGTFALGMAGAAEGTTVKPEQILILITFVTLMSGTLQILYGVIGGGTLIKYIPYPVVSGYLTGVTVVIFLKQLPGLFGFPKGVLLWTGLISPVLWQWPGLIVGLTTIALAIIAPRFTKAVPATVLGLAGGVAMYFLLALTRRELLQMEGNHLLIGAIHTGDSFTRSFFNRWFAMSNMHLKDLSVIVMPAITLSVLLSIDTLKTCVVVDALTRTRHKSNREIIGQGISNLAAAIAGGMPGAGTSGATLVNISSGGKTKLAGMLEGIFVLVAFLLLSRFVGWAPVAALSGILIVVACKMFDRKIFRLLKQRSTLLDFFVVASVVVVAVEVGLITASGVGIALAILLFIRDQVRGTVIHRKTYGNQIFSRQRRLPDELSILQSQGKQTVLYELEGNLFFGTTDQLLTQIEEDLGTRKYVILDLRRVRSVDLTAVHLLEQIESRLSERGGHLILTNVPKNLPTGQDLQEYFDEVGLIRPDRKVHISDQISDGLEWCEDRILNEAGWTRGPEESPLELREIHFLKGRKEETIRALELAVEKRSYANGERIFHEGEAGDELLFIRRGSVRIILPLADGTEYHIATFGRGDFFGDMAFLDSGIRSANAIASGSTDLYVLSRKRFDTVAEQHPRMGQQFFAELSRAIAIRLRQADGEIRALEEA